MSFVSARKAKPRRTRIVHEESNSPGHHHRHHDEIHDGPHMKTYLHEEEEYHHSPPTNQVKMKIMNPHDEVNQLLVEFPLDIIFNPVKLQNDPEEKKKLEVDIWKAIQAAVKDQALLSYDPCKGCPVPMDIKCMKGFVYKICIKGYQNTGPYALALRFPGTECSYRRNIDGTPAGTFVIDAETPYCCDSTCKYEARHKESVKTQLGKYGGYHSPEELWEGIHNYGQHVHVPSTCMGAAIVMNNIFDPKLKPRGFNVSTEIIMQHTDGTGYYDWPSEVLEKVNLQFQKEVVPRLQGKLIDFRCAEEYVIKIVRPDEKLDGKPERDYASREGTIHGDDPAGDQAFNSTHRLRAQVELFLGFTNKASIEQVCCP